MEDAVAVGRSSRRGAASMDELDGRGMSILSNAMELTELYEGLR